MEDNNKIEMLLDKHIASKTYDTYCKKILSNKQILANIMKGCIPEYANLSLCEIVDCSINGLKTVDLSIDGTLNKYDVLFEAKLPGTKDDKIALIINIET